MKNWYSASLLQASSSYWTACTLHAAVKLGIVERLPVPGDGVSGIIGGRKRGRE